MFSSPILRSALPNGGVFPNGMLYDFENNPFKAKKEWPPDFAKLSQKHQFRIERRYRRRAKLAWARPVWTKGTKLVQWGLIVFVLGYGVLYMDWDHPNKDNPPFKAIRERYKSFTNSIWTHNAAQLNAQLGQDGPQRADDASPSTKS